MTPKQMQRFLDEESREGKKETDAYRKLMRIIGVEWHPPLKTIAGEDPLVSER